MSSRIFFDDNEIAYVGLITAGLLMSVFFLLIVPQLTNSDPYQSLDPSSTNILLMGFGAIAVSPSLISGILHYLNIKGMTHWLIVMVLAVLIAFMVYNAGLLEVSYRNIFELSNS